ncbi:MAG: NirA family protein [Puniceicoccaceae bacterium]|nr:MAG: NirA family protein [Puniceicoccaceae bacterium]
MTTESDFSPTQKSWLEGFFTGVSRRHDLPPFVGLTADGRFTCSPAAASKNLAAPTVHGVPIDDLCREERIKHERHGLDIWETLLDNAARDRFPEGPDVFRYKFHGLFYVAPAQDALMLRCRIPGGVIRADQFAGIAHLARHWGGGYAHLTTRANLQVREIKARDSVDVLLHLRDLGLTAKGAGADNVRNITASPTSGFDPEEVCDVLPLARALHHFILNHREMYDLPRKFNIAFDNGGSVSVCADTNDLGFYAVRIREEAAHLQEDFPDRIGFRLQLCGITGHRQLAFDSGLLLRPEECVAVAAAMLRVFIAHGDRTNRKKARLKYLLDRHGLEWFLGETSKRLAFPLRQAPPETCHPRLPVVKHGYVGVSPQRDPAFNAVGVVVPVGYLDADSMDALACLARDYGRGELRLTVWQNLIIPHVPADRTNDFLDALSRIGLHADPHPVATGLVACTGNRGCRYAATDTKGQAIRLGEYLRDRVPLDEPVNIHLTGCPHSCAQHYIGDIGLLGAKVKRDGESVEGYHIVLGGGVDDRAGIGREILQAVPFEEIPPLLANLLHSYREQRPPGESFAAFTRRHSVEELRAFLSPQPVLP